MDFFGTIRNQGQPGETRTDLTEDLRAAIGQLFSEAQTAVFRGGNVDGTLWLQSGDVKTQPSVSVLSVKVNASKLPTLLLAGGATAPQLALSDGVKTQAPAIVACPYCEGVADLVDEGLVWRYRCDKCAFESTYSPAQCAQWLGQALIRSDRKRLAIPAYTEYPTGPGIPLASYFEAGEVRVYAVRPFGGNNGSLQPITLHDAGGKQVAKADCRKARSLDDARELVKAMVAQFGDTEQLVYHDPAVASALTTEIWLNRPVLETLPASLPRLLKALHGNSAIITLIDGRQYPNVWVSVQDGETLYIDGKQRDVKAEVAMVQSSLSREMYGANAGTAILFQREGWTPPAPAEKRAKGKKKTDAKESPAPQPAVNPESATGVVEEEQIRVLGAWMEVWVDDNDSAHQAGCNALYNDTALYLSALQEGAAFDAGVYCPLLEQWHKAYPDVEPFATQWPETTAPLGGCPTDTAERINLLQAWLDAYDLDEAPTGYQCDSLSLETESRIQLLQAGIIATEDDHEIIARWRMIYPDVDPLNVVNDKPEPYAAPADEQTPAFSTDLPEPPAPRVYPTAIEERVKLLKAWVSVYEDDPDFESDKKEILAEATNDRVSFLPTGCVQGPDDRDLVDQWEALYPGVNPMEYSSPFAAQGDGE